MSGHQSNSSEQLSQPDRVFLIKTAKRASEKRWDFEQLKYGDDLYRKEHWAADVWEFVEERARIGSTAFDAKYAEELKS